MAKFDKYEQIVVVTQNEDFTPESIDDADLYEVYAHCFEEDTDPNNDEYDVFSLTRELWIELNRDWYMLSHIHMGGVETYIYRRRE